MLPLRAQAPSERHVYSQNAFDDHPSSLETIRISCCMQTTYKNRENAAFPSGILPRSSFYTKQFPAGFVCSVGRHGTERQPTPCRSDRAWMSPFGGGSIN